MFVSSGGRRVLEGLQAVNRCVFPPIKTAYGTPTGEVTAKQIRFYEQVAHNGPG
jgi:2,4-dienoyl-CoA reductase-like NADH-dependent reductase (Old Yellow Enzyme family)